MPIAVSRPPLLLSFALLASGVLRGEEKPSPRTEEILGVFNRRCVECHGTAKQSNKLRLDSLEAVFQGGKGGPAIASGRSAESLLYRKVIPGAEKRMPPRGEPLAAEEIEAIRLWIDSGAKAGVKAGAAAEASGSGAAGTGATEAEAVRLEPLPETFQPVFSMAGDPAGGRIALARGRSVLLYSLPEGGEDAAKGKKEGKKEVQSIVPIPIAETGGPSDLVQSLAFSPDGKRLAAGEFRVARVYGEEGGIWKLLRTLSPHADRVLSLAVSPDGTRLAAGGGIPTESGEVKLWDLETGDLIWSVSPHSDTVLGLDWSPDGGRILTGAADRVISLLDARNGERLRRLEGHTHHVLAVAFGPDGKQAATAGADGVARLWDLSSGSYLKSLRGHEGAVTSVRFIKEGKQVITSSGDAQVRIWNASSGNGEGSFTEARGYLQAGASFASQKRYAAAEQDGAVRFYDLERKKLLLTLEGPGTAPR